MLRYWVRPADLSLRPSRPQIPRPLTPQTPSNEMRVNPDDQQLMMVVLAQLSGLYSRSTIGSLAVIGLVRTHA